MNLDQKSISILLVEDSEEDVFFFTRALKKCQVNATMKVVADGKAALDILSDPIACEQFDCVFLDLKLPLITGFEVLEGLREQGRGACLPIFILSGSPQMRDRDRAAQFGMADYLVKPVTSDVLRMLLRVPAHT